MASTKLMETKDGRKFWKISVSQGRGNSKLTTRIYWPTKANGYPVAESTALKELEKATAEFERACAAGEVQSRAEIKQKEAEEQAEAAKLKTVRQYADGVFMPTKEATFSENARASYRMFLDKHILPVIGDNLLVEITPAIITKLLIDFQKSGYSHATTIKLYNIINGVLEMAFLDDSIPMNPMLKVKRPKPRKDESMKEETDKAFTAKELTHILTCVEKEPLKWQAYINLAADTACRRGELCGLQWKDIDWNTGTITIRRNLQYTPQEGIYTAAPKNGKTRAVDVGVETLSLLRKLREDQAASCMSKWVFTQDEIPPTRCTRKAPPGILRSSGSGTA